MKQILRKILFPGCVLIFASCVQAETESGQLKAELATSQHTSSQTADSLSEASREEKAAAFGLTLDDWKKYEALMEGPRGYWSPGLDPLTALGIEAKSEAERIRYAELQVMMEFARTEAELAYQRAYDDAFKRLYPNVLPIGESDSRADDFLKNVPDVSALTNSPRIVFVTPQCSKCDSLVAKLQSENARFHIYVVGSEGKDDVVRNWAARVKIDPVKVKERHITLNHNTTELSTIAGNVKTSDLPLVYRRSGEAWQRVQ